MAESAVKHSHPEIVSGERVFVGTHIPVRSLLDWIGGSHTLDEFLAHFPSVTRQQAVTFLEQATRASALEPEQRDRLFTHGLHEEGVFYNRLNVLPGL